ncbi:10519_t:CDS:1 [Ambispora leptoticha]|uniref:10519_t:CDS:1 n=1 Tax=Ambispora leptoticha TaxID=144679 RepID=A0A9N9DP04_9GLOM|nr:10519_t:CDS:1 [Ambispora leptoticha]
MPKDFQNKNFSSFMPYFIRNEGFNLMDLDKIRNESFNLIDLDKIDVPYPLNGNLVSVLKNNLNEPSKNAPNCFILYRKAFKEILIHHGFRLNASKISRLASKNWKALADPVKQEYKKIAKELLENTEKHASAPSFKNKWRIVNSSDIKRKLNKKKKPSLDKTSEPNVANLKKPPMTTINAQENPIFPYANLNHIDPIGELFTYAYDLPETMLHVLNQNPIYSELPLTTINAQENSIFPYAHLSHIDSFEELFTYTYDLPKTMLLNQNLISPELSMMHFYEHFTDFQSISTTFQETESEYFMNHV